MACLGKCLLYLFITPTTIAYHCFNFNPVVLLFLQPPRGTDRPFTRANLHQTYTAMAVRTFDSIIIGAGISGINLAYRLQSQLPNHTYTILESRAAIGGTWDLFQYPGIRSDSDLYTFGFTWRPWSEQTSIAEGGAIKKYVRESAEMYGIDKKIRFGRNVRAADWKSDGQEWVLEVEEEGQTVQYRCRFLQFCTGYYVGLYFTNL